MLVLFGVVDGARSHADAQGRWTSALARPLLWRHLVALLTQLLYPTPNTRSHVFLVSVAEEVHGIDHLNGVGQQHLAVLQQGHIEYAVFLAIGGCLGHNRS